MKVRHASSSKRHSSRSPSGIQALRRELKEARARSDALEKLVQSLQWRLEDQERELRVLRQSRSATEDLLQKEIRQLNKEVADRDELLEKVNAQVTWFRENYFAGNRSERDGAESGAAEEVRSEGETDQESTESSETASPSAEVLAVEGEVQDADGQPKRNRGQQPGTRGPNRSDRSQLRPESEYLGKEGCACGTCGKAYRR